MFRYKRLLVLNLIKEFTHKNVIRKIRQVPLNSYTNQHFLFLKQKKTKHLKSEKNDCIRIKYFFFWSVYKCADKFLCIKN